MTRRPRDERIRLPLAASLPGCILLLAGFVLALLIGIDRIGVWKTLAVWAFVFGTVAVALLVMLRRQRER